MPYDFSKLETLPLRGKVSVITALMALKLKGNHAWTDWECSNQYHNRYCNRRAKNAKAKHRKKFNR